MTAKELLQEWRAIGLDLCQEIKQAVEEEEYRIANELAIRLSAQLKAAAELDAVVKDEEYNRGPG